MKPCYKDDAQNVELYLGDFRQVMRLLRPGLFDGVIVDPPYPAEYLPLWADLARLSTRSLKRGGSLLSIMPHYAIPAIVQTVSYWLKWRWLIAMQQESGSHARMAMGVEVTWKPIGWWVKDAWPAGRGFIRDSFVNDRPDKSLHRWQQSPSWAHAMLRFVPPGGSVLDPMAGSGTLVLAARSAGYAVVGIDNDPACIEMTIRQLEADTRAISTAPGVQIAKA